MTRFSYSVPTPVYARLTPVGADIAFESSYDRALIDAFKLAIPASGRKWDPAKKRWLIAPQHAEACAKLAQTYLGVTVAVPTATQLTLVAETRLITLEYLARCKDRNGECSAFGWVDGGWNAIFPEEVLRTWFDSPKQPTENQTLYQTLAAKKTATPDEIRSAYRRMARSWHPDVCKEPNATEQFKAIQHAYEVLSDPIQRKKYDAGLWLEAKAKRSIPAPRMEQYFTPDGESTYIPPYRCGYLLCEGNESLGRFVVSKITMWEDCIDEQGRTMVTSWPVGADHFEVCWQ